MTGCSVFTNYIETAELCAIHSFDGFFYYANDDESTLLLPATSIPSYVAYDYTVNAITINGTPTSPDCNGYWSGLTAIRSSCNTSTGLSQKVSLVANPFFDPNACSSAPPIRQYIMYNNATLANSKGEALSIYIGTYC